MKSNCILIIVLFTISYVFGQKKEICKVLNNELKGKYIGQCSNGLADGKGEFTFANGSFVYVGYFKDGRIEGKGEIFSITNNKRTSLKKGIWENNVYIGNTSKPYQVNQNVNLDRYTVNKTSNIENKLIINFYQNGNRNNVSNLNVAVNNGDLISDSYTYGYKNIHFPFSCRITYTTSSKLKSTNYSVVFEIEINEPGSWEISLFN